MEILKPSAVRLDSAHTVLWYLQSKTSVKHPEWRDAILSYLVSLYELAVRNYALRIQVQRIDGIYVYHQEKLAFYVHIYQKHLLLHLSPACLLWKHKILHKFNKPHKGSWDQMFKLSSLEELKILLGFLRSLPRTSPRQYYASRTIPARVQEIVWDRDRGRCVSCGSTKELQFDHIVPFSKGGTSKTAQNVQILCLACNLRKGNRSFV